MRVENRRCSDASVFSKCFPIEFLLLAHWQVTWFGTAVFRLPLTSIKPLYVQGKASPSLGTTGQEIFSNEILDYELPTSRLRTRCMGFMLHALSVYYLWLIVFSPFELFGCFVDAFAFLSVACAIFRCNAQIRPFLKDLNSTFDGQSKEVNIFVLGIPKWSGILTCPRISSLEIRNRQHTIVYGQIVVCDIIN